MSPEFLAAVFLGSLLALLAAVPMVSVLRSRYNLLQTPFTWVNAFLTKTRWRTSVPNRLPLPDDQGGVIISNHRSSVDPFFIQLAVGRICHWMVAREAFELAGSGWFMRICQAIPVRRGGVDTASIKMAIRLASQGGLIGMFPEGRINQTDEFMMTLRPGAALIALKARVPVLPCFIEGAPYEKSVWSPFRLRARVKVKFGQPVDLTEYYDREKEDGIVNEIMLKCAAEIARLGGRPDFQPTLAGRKWNKK